MKTDYIRLMTSTEYYIWWLKNCSTGVSVQQKEKEILSILKKIDSVTDDEDFMKTPSDFFDSLFDLRMDLFIYSLQELCSLYEKDEIPSRFPGRVQQFLAGTGAW